MKTPIILIADANPKLLHEFEELLIPYGVHCLSAHSGDNIFEIIDRKHVKLIFTCVDSKDPQASLSFTKSIRKQNPSAPIILFTPVSSEDLAISALKAGATDYFKLPFSNSDFLNSIKRHLPHAVTQEPRKQAACSPFSAPERTMICSCATMQKVKAYLLKVAATDSTVLITGETGTGKELAAELIHRHGPRRNKSFVCVNCAALPEHLVESELFGYEKGAFTGAMAPQRGKFVQAHGGTLFLDEIGDMSLLAQAKTLRSIERKEAYPLGAGKSILTDVRIITATNQNLNSLVNKGKFRQDLFYRLNIFQVNLPPLRERKEDIPALVELEIEKLNRRFNRTVEGLSDEAISALFKYQWPGNIRELNNLLKVAYLSCSSKKIKFADLPHRFAKSLKYSKKNISSERDMLLAVLEATKWNKSKAAKKLKWSRMRVYRALQRYKITYTKR